MTTENEARDYHGRWTAGGGGGVPGETRNVAFHGTTKSFEKFSRGNPTEFMLDRALGPHFAKDPEIANSFVIERVNGRDVGPKEGGRIIPVVLPSDEHFLQTEQPRFDWAKDNPNLDKTPGSATGERLKEYEARPSDQSVIEQMVGEEGFKKDPAILERYLEQARNIPADEAPKIAAALTSGKTAFVDGKDRDLHSFVQNVGARPYNDADRARLVELARQSWEDKGYAGIKYINTSPMENATATNPASYIVFNPDKDVKPLYGDEHHPETQRYLDYYDRSEPTDYHPGVKSEDTAARAVEHAKQIAGDYKPLEGLPQPVMHLKDGYYQPGPVGSLKDASAAYMKKAGMEYEPIQKYQPADPEQGAKIAQAFDQMKHDPDNPAVKAAYAALAKETMGQWQSIKDTGLKVEWIKPGQADPYADTPRSAERDVVENNHWWGFPTDLGFGSDPNLKGNPLLKDSGEMIGGRHASVNDVFRIVHDIYGHIKDGNGFTPSGEENAWRSHYAMFSPLARDALTTETRGQTDWVNFGPHGGENRSKLYGVSAVASNTGGSGVVYAPQKIGLLPKWAQDGAKDRP